MRSAAAPWIAPALPASAAKRSGDRNTPARLSSAAATTLAATLPPAIELAAVADWTVDGNMPRKRKPSASVGGSSGAVNACAPSPNSAIAPKQKAKVPPCNFQLRMPCITS